jgi:MoaA/NifB/PqqE/SkfB family radical SAM enzyme
LDNCIISLDSTDSSVHDERRGIPGLHAKVRECLRWVGEDFLSGHHTGGIMCVLSHWNLHQVANVVRLAEDLGVYVVFQPHHPKKTGDTTRQPPITQETVGQLLDLKRRSSAVLSSRSYLSGMADFCQGSTTHRCQAGYKYFSVDPYGYVHPCVDTPPVGHLLKDDVSAIRSPRALSDVLSCSGCWYCFRGEADCMLSTRGYFEKLHAALSVVLRNTLRNLRRPRSNRSVAGLEETGPLPQPDLCPAHEMVQRAPF